MKKYLSLVLMLVTVVTLAACGNKEDNIPSFKDADLRLANSSIAEDLDFHTTSLASDFTILNNINEGLVRLKENDEVVEGVAKSWSVSEDQLVYTFTLRQDATWSNGDTVTADDFVYSWHRAVNPPEGITVKYASMYDMIKNGSAIRTGEETDVTKLGIEAVDEYTVKVTLEQPTPYFLPLMAFPAFYPAHQETIEEYGKDYGKKMDNLIYNGPFKVTYWNTDYGVYLEKNETYWDKDAVKIESVSYRAVEDPTTRLSLYDADELDRVGVTGEQYEDRMDVADVYIDPVQWYLIFNTEDENFSNKNLRLAFKYGIDKAELVQALKPYVPADEFVPRGYSVMEVEGEYVDFRDFVTANADATEVNYDESTNGIFDAKVAQDYLDLALNELGEDSITVKFKAFDSDGWKPLFENIRNQLSRLEGLTVELDKKPAAGVYDSYDGRTYEFGFYGWGPDYPDPMSFLELYHSEDSHNVLKKEETDVLNAEFDALIEAARGDNPETSLLDDPVARWEALVQAEALLLEEAYVVPLAQRAGGTLQQGRVSGVIKHNFGPDYSWKWVEVTD
ncbi:peptide ABC transporter substrate-binding protein [Haloplasma contractile]|uniref:Oligopeptide ABC transporter protein n=1 Tax=Haloplasma contractile SSD-17B TaxID=1033810 RepID=U2DYT3_9MOLU|nr:peptide ABC transporter substrate-binding protein [Haloplasma contractile]ERJ13402.1 Oligopeptide ABC transporter protein [Haloplasma contractile SSD-17B]